MSKSNYNNEYIIPTARHVRMTANQQNVFELT